MLEQFRSFVPEKLDVDEVLALYAFGQLFKSSYATFSMEPPEWVKENLVALEKEVRDRRRDALERERKQVRLALEGLKTKEERRSDLQRKLDRLDSLLNS